jgi:hypothetical protein
LTKTSGQLFSWLTDPTTVMLSVDPTAPTSYCRDRIRIDLGGAPRACAPSTHPCHVL